MSESADSCHLKNKYIFDILTEACVPELIKKHLFEELWSSFTTTLQKCDFMYYELLH